MKLEEIFSFNNLYAAHKRCRLSKQHKRDVIQFEMSLGTNLVQLNKELVSRKYKFGAFRVFKLFDPKERLIEAPPYRDRVVLMCFAKNCLEKKIESKLIYDNAACRVNRGTHFGMRRLQGFMREEYFKERSSSFYYLKCDISKYFASVNHEVLLSMLQKAGFSEDELWFIKKLVCEQPGYNLKGMPLGNQTSQWFALLYLNRIDRLIKEELRVHGYVRYMDDFILLHRSKEYLRSCLARITEVCENELKLSLNRKTQIGKVGDGIDFLGFRHSITETGKVVVRLRSVAKIRMKRHLKTIGKMHSKGIVDDKFVELRKNAYSAHLSNSNANAKLKALVKKQYVKPR